MRLLHVKFPRRTPKDMDDMRGSFTFSVSQIKSYVLGSAQFGRPLVETDDEIPECPTADSTSIVKAMKGESVDEEVVFKVCRYNNRIDRNIIVIMMSYYRCNTSY